MVFISLLETSAYQLDVAKRVLRSLALVDPELALAFSDMLNTVDRRDIGVQEVLTAYIRQDVNCLSTEIISRGLAKINDKRLREQTLLKLIVISRELKLFASPTILVFFLNIINSIDDPILKAKSSAFILSVIEKDDEQCKNVFWQMLDAWEKIDIIWMRVECGFDLSSIIAGTHAAFAEDLYEKTKALRRTSSLANQPIGLMYYEILRIASRAVGGLNFLDINSKDAWNKLIQSIELIPSKSLKKFAIWSISNFEV